MDEIIYIDEENNKHFYTDKEFVFDSWLLDFDFVLEKAMKIETIRYDLLKQLVLRSNSSEQRNKIKQLPCYNELINRLYKDDDVLVRAKFIIFFESSFISNIDCYKLVYDLIEIAYTNEIEKPNAITLLYSLFSITNDISLQRFITGQLNRLYDPEYDSPKIYNYIRY